MTALTNETNPRPTGFGFAAIMAAARFDRFPVWYGANCLLPTNPFKNFDRAGQSTDAAEVDLPRAA